MAPSGIPIPGVFFVQRPSGAPGSGRRLVSWVVVLETMAAAVSLHIDGVFVRWVFLHRTAMWEDVCMSGFLGLFVRSGLGGVVSGFFVKYESVTCLCI